jgi:hypothetical protein
VNSRGDSIEDEQQTLWEKEKEKKGGGGGEGGGEGGDDEDIRSEIVRRLWPDKPLPTSEEMVGRSYSFLDLGREVDICVDLASFTPLSSSISTNY